MVLGAEAGREVWGRRRIRIGFAKEQRFQFGVKELWRDGKGRGLSELVGWVNPALTHFLGEFPGLGLIPDVVVPEADQRYTWSRKLDPNFCPGRDIPQQRCHPLGFLQRSWVFRSNLGFLGFF